MIRESRTMDWSLLKLGLRGGAAAMLFLWWVWDVVIDGPRHPVIEHNKTSLARAIPIYRGIGCLLLIPWLWGCNITVWRKLRINYMYVLNCDAREALTNRAVSGRARFHHACLSLLTVTVIFCPNVRQVFNQASLFTIIYFANFIVRAPVYWCCSWVCC